MKIIKINEIQRDRLFEAYQEGFSFETLSMIGNGSFPGDYNPEAQMRYCEKWLGEPVSEGSSRIVYTLSDNMVLKLANECYTDGGIAQNRREFSLYQKINSPLLTRIFYHDKRFTYLVSESVLPCSVEDFEKILGIPYNHVYRQNSVKIPTSDGGDYNIGFNKYFHNIKQPSEESEVAISDILLYIEYRYVNRGKRIETDIEETIKKSKWLKELVKLVSKTKMTDLSIDNFGLVNRDGKPMIVILDSGFNNRIWRQYYKEEY